jgi:hypothetical protein
MSVEVEDEGGTDVPPMTLDGKDAIVMVLFYTGEPLSGQSRPSTVYTDYLEQTTIIPGYTVDFRSVGANSTVFNDYVIAITRKEWEAALLSRVKQDFSTVSGDGVPNGVPDMCEDLSDTDISWFNACKYIGTNIPSFSADPFPDTCTHTGVIAEENITGQDWRSVLCP